MKESFINLPNLAENRNCTFIIEQNGNRLRLYNGETKQLIIEFMQVSQEWINKMITYIKSDYTNKPAALKVIEEKLEHPWSDPVTGMYKGVNDSSITSKTTIHSLSDVNVTVNKQMSVSENLKLRAGEATS